MAADIDALWDYAKPAGETPFTLKTETNDAALEIETRRSRAPFSMRRDFCACHRRWMPSPPEPRATRRRACVSAGLLERGRTLNSSGQFEKAKPLFSDAFQLAQRERGVARH